jgi:hypothetical protein
LKVRDTLLGVAVFQLILGSVYSQVTYVEVTEPAGIHFRHNNGATGKKLLPETMGSGGAFFDYNNDGWLDIFLPNGMKLEGRSDGSSSALYRNNQDGTFTDVSGPAGLAVQAYGMGVASADYDNDGDMDLYVAGLGPDHLYQNLGNGRFRDVTRASGLGNPEYGTSCAFLDFDRDGLLDLFVANYVDWTLETDIYCSLDGQNKSYCTPEPYKGVSSRLYRNLGSGKFEDVTERANLLDDTNKGLGVLVFDYNKDEWPDIMLANDTQPNKLWENRGDGTFEEVGVLAGIAFSEDGLARGAMGIDAGDYDRSGHMSVLIGNFSNEMISLYHNEQAGFFIDDAPTSAVGPASLLSLTFGAFFFDFDLDGWLDIFAANGHVENDIGLVQKRVSYAQPALLFRNLDGRKFEDVTSQTGSDLAKPVVARGAAFGDYDNDGDLDILVTTCGSSPRLLRNDGGNQNKWLSVLLEGEKSNRNGIGSTIIVRSSHSVLTGYVKTGGSYCSQSQLRLTFGLGKSNRVLSVEVLWPSGKRQVVDSPPINQLIRVSENGG